MSDVNAALAYAKELYAAEMEWHRAYEEKVLRYQTLSGAVLGVGALALSNVQFALRQLSTTRLGIVFLTGAVVTGIAAGWAIVASLRVMNVATINRPPANDEVLKTLADQDTGKMMSLAQKFAKTAHDIRELNVQRGFALNQVRLATAAAIAGGAACLVLAVFVKWPPKVC